MAIARVYSGRPGCRCGCRGVYYATNLMIKKVSRIFEREWEEGNPSLVLAPTYADVVIGKRVYTVYMTE